MLCARARLSQGARPAHTWRVSELDPLSSGPLGVTGTQSSPLNPGATTFRSSFSVPQGFMQIWLFPICAMV